MIDWKPISEKPEGPKRKVLIWLESTPKIEGQPQFVWWFPSQGHFAWNENIMLWEIVTHASHWAEITPPGTGVGRATWSTGDEGTGGVTITESQRLKFLMQFFCVEDVGDESVCPGVVVDTDAVEDAFNCGALADETVTLMDGWHNPDMRRVIDKAIASAAIGPLPKPIRIPNSVLESNILPLENLVLPANGPVIMSLSITETDGASNQ